MTAWSFDTRFCASPLQRSYVPGSPTSSLSSHNSDESSLSQASIASSQTSISSSNSWRDEFDSSLGSGKSCAKFDAAALARQRSHADYRKSCLKSSSQCEDAWPTTTTIPCHALTPTGLVHPRRSTFCPARVKPSLVRQSDRREDFVEYLVDTATQMVAVIWPKSTKSLTSAGSEAKNQVLPLRIFIKETLRRSRTSYSTLQVAMYYLILIKSKARLPRCDFPEDDPLDSTECRVMHCGRRMFLAALILASKYLQDRNYSARAWSKISGLKIHEINSNELAFLAAVDWKLHISEETFLRWTDIVTTYTNSMHHFGPRAGLTKSITSSWTSLVKRLTPALEFTQTTWSRPSTIHRPGPEYDTGEDRPVTALSMHTPKSSPTRPSLMETCKHETQFRIPPTPRMNGHLTTPISTPSSTVANTPAQHLTRSPAHGLRAPSQAKPSELIFEGVTSLESKFHSASQNNKIVSCNSDMPDLGIVSLLEAAKELGWSGDEADDEMIKETPLSSPSLQSHMSACSSHSESTRSPFLYSSLNLQSSDEDDTLARRVDLRTAMNYVSHASMTTSMETIIHRKRRLNSSVDLIRTLPSSNSEDVSMNDGAELDMISSISRSMKGQTPSHLGHSRVPVQRSLSGRKRVCCA